MAATKELIQHYEMVKIAVLETVYKARWERCHDGVTWRPIPRDQKTFNDIEKNWTVWKERFLQKISSVDGNSPDRRRLETALVEADKAMMLQLLHTGPKTNAWQLIFKYEKYLSILPELLEKILVRYNEVNSFTEAHATQFKKFFEEHPKTTNIFVAINYDNSDEVQLILNLLKDCEKCSESIKFHFAKDKAWLKELYSNLMFYSIACDAGLVFFTEANQSEKDAIHNPNVAFEYGFISGLGKPCAMFRHSSVNAFTDVAGLLHWSYSKATETKPKVEEFLVEELGIALSC